MEEVTARYNYDISCFRPVPSAFFFQKYTLFQRYYFNHFFELLKTVPKTIKYRLHKEKIVQGGGGMNEKQARALISALNEEEKEALYDCLSLMEKANQNTRQKALDILREGQA